MAVRPAARWGVSLITLVCAYGPAAAQQQPGAAPRLLPDITAVSDIVLNLSPRRSLGLEADRFSVREVEVGLLAAVDPYFRGDIYVGLSDEEGAAIEQAYLTATALPGALEARLGRFLMPLGKQNTTHRHDLHTVEYPYVLQEFLGDEGLKGTGVWVSRVFAPLGFYQEVLVTAVERLAGEEEEGEALEVEEPASRSFGGLGYSARLRNYWDLSSASNLEISFSGATSRRPQPLADGTGLNVRQSLAGADLTFRWRPLRQGLYRSFIVQAEVLRQFNQKITGSFYQGPTRDFTGAYLFARYQLTRRLYLGARGDWVQLGSEDDPAATEALRAASAYLQFFPSEFSKLLAGYERVDPVDGSARNRILVQATFALGPHRPHPF